MNRLRFLDDLMHACPMQPEGLSNLPITHALLMQLKYEYAEKGLVGK
jgi:hypothetical protein